nr:C383 [uncultured bacterium]
MAVRIVRLGSPRAEGEGTRIGTVRRPPRGVPKSEFAAQDWYDVWYPDLAPSADTVRLGLQATTDAQWAIFVKRYRAEMGSPQNSRTLDLLATLSRHADFSVGCYCEHEARCHRSVLRELLRGRGAVVA